MSIVRVRSLAVLLSTAFSLPASAGPADALHLFAGVGYGHDDNLLRIPDGQPAFGGIRAESWWDREAGLIFDKAYGHQRISAVAKLSKYDFNHFRQLDYDGKDLQASWLWQLGNRLQGKLGVTYAQVLAPYTDFFSNERNLRRSRSRYADGAWRFHSAWRVRAGVQRDSFSYEVASQRYNDRSETASELELDYLPKTGSTVGLVARHVSARYPNLRPIGPLLFSDNYTQDELKARVLWQFTGSTSIDTLVGRTSRSQPSYGTGRTSGLTGRIKGSWQPRGKITCNAAIWRDFAALESILVSTTLNKGVSAGAQWEATAKIKLNADVAYVRRSYEARRSFAGSGDLRDALRTGSLSTTWTPRPTVQLSAALAHQSRSGSPVLGTGSFRSNSLTLSANLQF